MERAAKPEAASEASWPLIGRREELANLTAALRLQRSRLVLGPPGSGKTRLVQEAVRLAGQPHVWIQHPGVLHALLVELAEQLRCRLQRFKTLDRATSIALKPAVLESLRKEPRCIVIEDFSHGDPRTYRFFQEIYYISGTCLVVTATSRSDLGFLGKLLWDPREEITLGPLSRSEAKQLFDLAAERFELRSLDLDDFRPKVLAAAHGNPGKIVAMCRFASRAEYQSGRHIKFYPLWIDVLASMSHP